LLVQCRRFLWMIGMLVGEVVHPQGDVRRAWRAIRQGG
jgi:hypothetical protein